jgi:CRISPR/Cas system-associated protein Cas10 (large subunit of type III CRISPR-Cas system)
MHFGRLVGALSAFIAASKETTSESKFGLPTNTSYNLTAIKDCDLYKVSHSDLIKLCVDTKKLRYNFVRQWIQNKLLESINIKSDKIVEVKSLGLTKKALYNFITNFAIQ